MPFDIMNLWFPLLIIFAISLIDFVVLTRARFTKHHAVHSETKEDSNFTILIPIFGKISYLKNIDFLKKYASHVVLCTTTQESASFNADIQKISAQYGFRIFRSEVPIASKHRQQASPWRLFNHTLHGKGALSDSKSETTENKINLEIARDEIIRDSFSVIDTDYSVFLDGDTVAKKSITKLIHLMRELNFDLASVRVLASKKETLVEKLQSVEYELAMDARKVYPWLTSGACMVAKTDAIKRIMQHHSLFFSGGDIEIGKIAGLLKLKVGHLRFRFYTDVPSTLDAWFKQRMAWFGGGFRHAIVNFHIYSWRHPMFYLYTTVIVYGLTPLRIWEAISHPWVIPVVIVIYWFLIAVFHWKKLKWFYLLFPFYALLQIMILIPLGMLKYIHMVMHTRNAGIIRLRYKENRKALSV